MTEFIFCFWKDMKVALGYLHYGILLGSVVLLALVAWSVFRKKWRKPQWYVACFLLAVYGGVALWMAFLGREPGSRTGASLIPLESWGKGAQGNAYVVENVVMFLPFGFLVPLVIRAFRHPDFFPIVFSGFLCSCLIEFSQLLTGRGYFQVDDIWTNTLGTAVGYGIYRLWLFLCQRMKEFRRRR